MIADDRFLFKVVAECLIDTGRRGSHAGHADCAQWPAAAAAAAAPTKKAAAHVQQQ
jgi:hypothetical protein